MMIATKLHEKKSMQADQFTYLSAETYNESQIIDMEHKICSALRFHLHIVTPYHFVHRLLRASYVSTKCSSQGCSSRGNGSGSNMYRYTSSLLSSPSQSLPSSSLSSSSPPPPPCSFMWKEDRLSFMVDYLLEIAMLEFDFVPMKPSLVATGAIYLARAMLGIRDVNDSFCSGDNYMGNQEENEKRYGYFFNQALEHYSGYKVKDLVHVVILLHTAHKNSVYRLSSVSLNAVHDKYSSSKFKCVALNAAPIDKKHLFPVNLYACSEQGEVNVGEMMNVRDTVTVRVTGTSIDFDGESDSNAETIETEMKMIRVHQPQPSKNNSDSDFS